MKTTKILNRNERLRWALSTAWNTCINRIATGRIRINKESSLQLHYSYILAQFGELACIEKAESFVMELETHHAGKNIDIWCSLNGIEAAIELKCFRKQSNRATDIDMYDVLNDISRLESYTHISQRNFICLTDNEYYTKATHSGHAGSVSIGAGKKYQKQASIVPTWAGKWKDTSRDKGMTFVNDVEFNWQSINDWYYLLWKYESQRRSIPDRHKKPNQENILINSVNINGISYQLINKTCKDQGVNDKEKYNKTGWV